MTYNFCLKFMKLLFKQMKLNYVLCFIYIMMHLQNNPYNDYKRSSPKDSFFLSRVKIVEAFLTL